MQNSQLNNPGMIYSQQQGEGEFQHQQDVEDDMEHTLQPTLLDNEVIRKSAIKAAMPWILKRRDATIKAESILSDKMVVLQKLLDHQASNTFPDDLENCKLHPYKQYPMSISLDDRNAARDEEEGFIYSVKVELLDSRVRRLQADYDRLEQDYNNFVAAETVLEKAQAELVEAAGLSISATTMATLPDLLHNLVVAQHLAHTPKPIVLTRETVAAGVNDAMDVPADQQAAEVANLQKQFIELKNLFLKNNNNSNGYQKNKNAGNNYRNYNKQYFSPPDNNNYQQRQNQQRKNGFGRGNGDTAGRKAQYRNHDPRERSASQTRSRSKSSNRGNQRQPRGHSNDSRGGKNAKGRGNDGGRGYGNRRPHSRGKRGASNDSSKR
jgi:hypothetical protein